LPRGEKSPKLVTLIKRLGKEARRGLKLDNSVIVKLGKTTQKRQK
jgi:hypothetical protein